MKRIGVVTYTRRWPKGTSRTKRQHDWRLFVTAAKIMNAEYKRIQPKMEIALKEYVLFGRAAVHVAWDDTSASVEVSNVAQDEIDKL